MSSKLLSIDISQFYNHAKLGTKWCIKEYFRLWKLVGLFLVISFLIIGSMIFKLPDWDIPISIIMPLFTYFFAPISLWLLLNFKKKAILRQIFSVIISLCLCWISIDFIYCYYNDYYHHHYYRESNFVASFILYWLSAFFLSYVGNFKSLKQDIQTIKVLRDKYEDN